MKKGWTKDTAFFGNYIFPDCYLISTPLRVYLSFVVIRISGKIDLSHVSIYTRTALLFNRVYTMLNPQYPQSYETCNPPTTKSCPNTIHFFPSAFYTQTNGFRSKREIISYFSLSPPPLTLALYLSPVALEYSFQR